MDACPICAAHRGEGRPGGRRIATNSHIVVSHAPGPEFGHLYIETRRHVPYLADLTDDEAAAVGVAAARLARALRAEPGVAMVFAAVAGRRIAHFHEHLVVRTEGTPDDVPWHASDDWAGALRGDEVGIAALCGRLAGALTTG